MSNLFVRWQTFVGGIRHKPAIGAVVFAIGVVWWALAGGTAPSGVPSFLIGLGAGIVLLALGTK